MLTARGFFECASFNAEIVVAFRYALDAAMREFGMRGFLECASFCAEITEDLEKDDLAGGAG